jgi:hypothetical protein
VLIKIFALIFALFAFRRTAVRYRKGMSLMLEFLLWSAIWAGVATVVFFPQKTDAFARWLGVSTGYNALMFIAVMGLLFSVYRLLIRTQNLEREITRLVRAQALQSVEPIKPRPRDVEPSTAAS